MSNNDQAIVVTRSGKLEGSYEDGLYVFKRIPYAAPPVGERRWLAPQPVEPWDGVRPAREFGPIAPQNVMVGGPIVHVEQPQDEDCLFLNIWTSGLDDGRRPVMVWIHGGAFTIGSGSDAMYNNGVLARRGDVVFVSINYRLGMLGFLRLKDVTGGKIPSTGNEGLLDQVAALKWVKENIAAFGGDPANVTVFGESAGAMSIGSLMGMPAARGLFHKGILESGAGGTVITVDRANMIAGNFLEAAGTSGDDAAALRALKTERLLNIELELRKQAARVGEAMMITVTVPVVDGEVIPDVPNQAIKKGSARDIPVIAGTNLEEWKLFGLMQPGMEKLDSSMMLKILESYLPAAQVPGLVAAYRDSREKRGDTTAPFELLSAIFSDVMFRIPALELIEAQRDNGQRAYNYLFTWKSPVMNGLMGACHALEIGFVFGLYDDMFCGSGPEADRLSGYIQDAWLAFARSGDPSCKSLGEWPVYGRERSTMVLGRDSHVEAAPFEDERRVLEKVKPEYYPMP
jgi:para-nitrobenzyl esterase